jgi:L-arabinokinase
LTGAPTLVAYVSGHGFGHSVRTAAVLGAFHALAPAWRIAVVTAGPETVFREAVGDGLLFRAERTDVGLVQKGALVIDTAATLAECQAFARELPARVEREAEWLGEVGARLVMGDVPPLAFRAAARAGVPGIGVTNFSWDWIYRHLARHEPGLAAAADDAAAAYAQATRLLQLPFAGDLSAFAHRTPMPLVVRRASVTRAEGRRRLGVGLAPAVLLSFGGLGLPGLEFSVFSKLRSFQFLSEPTGSDAPPTLRVVSLAELAAHGMTYLDLVAAADVVVTKPGYGIVSDAIACRTRMVYTERGDFPEYPILVEAMPRWLPAVHVSNADLFGGRLRPALDAVLAAPFPHPPRMDGAEVAARALLAEASAGGAPLAP